MAANKPFLAYLIPFLLLTGLVTLILTELHTPGRDSNAELNLPMPNFSVPSLLIPNEVFTPANLTGKVSLLVFWASWCPACKREFPTLLDIQKNYHTPIYSIILNDDPKDAKSFLQQHGNPFITTGVDADTQVSQQFNIVATPETFIIDKQGHIRYRYIGGINLEIWREVFMPLINQYNAET